jgi:NOL1/NOP2/sun family putative RNA methylase
MTAKAKKQSEIKNQHAAIPAVFLARMEALLGADFAAFAAIYDQPATHGLRVNTLKLSPDHLFTLSPFHLTPLPWNPSGFLLNEPEDRPGKHPFHAAGLYYLQDPHAQAVAEVLAPQPGERVLDLAAAPGGKTTHIASKMQNQGLLVANEIKTKRIGHLASNLERWGARNVTITNETPERLAEFFGPFFDRVLVDAPCSGEGMFRKDPSARAAWSEDMIAGCAVRQTAILHYAARLVRPGGWLGYSTCTYAPEENETVIEAFLQHHRDFEPAKAVRLWPHTSPGEGHFIAVLQRRENAASGVARPPQDAAPLAGGAASLWELWAAANLAAPLGAIPSQVGSRLYALPAGLPNLSGLRVLHPGWWLGDLKKDRFEPAHALAMALTAPDARRLLTLSADDPAIFQYLRGETLVSDGEPGWTLVTVNGLTRSFPIGWGKRVQGILKNHYPRGLAWL